MSPCTDGEKKAEDPLNEGEQKHDLPIPIGRPTRKSKEAARELFHQIARRECREMRV